MSLDQYSLCPGGTGKKIKFCCPDQIEELSAIERALENQQFRAAIDRIDRMEEKQRAAGTPTSACVFALRSMVLRAMDMWDEASVVVDAFAAAYPENTVAMAELAIHRIRREGGIAVMPLVQKVMASDQLSAGLSQVYGMLRLLAMAMLQEREYLATVAVHHVMLALNPEDQGLQDAYVRLLRIEGVPACAKEVRLVRGIPGVTPTATDEAGVDGAAAIPAEAERFGRALSLATRAQWLGAAEMFESLATEAGATAAQRTAAWYNVGVLRAWMAERGAAVAALRNFAALADTAGAGVSADDAIDAESLALFLRPTPLGDEVPLYGWVHPIREPESLDEAMRRSRRLSEIRMDWSRLRSEGNPAPRSGYMVCERDVPDEMPTGDAAEGTTADALAGMAGRVIGRLFVFGRETDRPARIEALEIADADRAAVMQILAEDCGGLLDAAENEATIDRGSLFLRILQDGYRLPKNADPELVGEALQTLVTRRVESVWLDYPLQCLTEVTSDDAAGEDAVDEMTLRVAATLPALRYRVAAIVAWLRTMTQETDSRLDIEALAERLGVPAPTPIDPTTLAGSVESLPISRLGRVDVTKLGDAELTGALERLVAVSDAEGIRRYALEMASRSSLAAEPILLLAYDQLAQLTEDPAEAIGYIERGRALATHHGRSCGAWDLMELGLRFRIMDTESIGGLIQHIQRHHRNEREVMYGLQQLLMQVGLIGADGRPTAAARQAAAMGGPSGGAQTASGLVIPGGAAEGGAGGGGGIWTPDGVVPVSRKAESDTASNGDTTNGGAGGGNDAGAGSGGKSGLWIPD